MDGEKILNHSQRVGKPDTLQKGASGSPFLKTLPTI